MKKQLLLITTLCLSILFSSCKKDDDNSTATPTPVAPEYFFSFNLDGVPTYIKGAKNNVYYGVTSGAYSGASFFNFTTDISLSININKDSILGSDFQALIGQKLPFIGCGGCPETNVYLNYDINGDNYTSFEIDNALPAYYLKITSVSYLGFFNQFGEYYEKYVVTGEFNARISSGGTVKNLTNGTFKLIFPAAFD